VSVTALEALEQASITHDIPASFAALVARRFKERTHERFVLMLSGGPLATACYRELAETTASTIDWELVDVLIGDERFVPASHPEANQGMIRSVLVDPLGNVGSFTPMGTAGDPQAEAEAYSLVLQGILGASGIDLIHLGVGPDGHTASLFPGSPSLRADREHLVVATEDPAERNPHRRLTVTLPVIEAARLAVFTVGGREKHEAIDHLLTGEDLPAGRVTAASVEWLIDGGARYGERGAED
jgi:6-phosphogluconolactonase